MGEGLVGGASGSIAGVGSLSGRRGGRGGRGRTALQGKVRGTVCCWIGRGRCGEWGENGADGVIDGLIPVVVMVPLLSAATSPGTTECEKVVDALRVAEGVRWGCRAGGGA